MIKRSKKAKPNNAQADAFSRLVEDNGSAAGKHQPGKAAGARRLGKHLMLSMVIVCSLLLVAVCGMGIAGYVVTTSPEIFPSVYVGGIPVGGLSEEAAKAKLAENGWDEKVSGELKVNIPADTSFSLSYVTSGAELSAQQAVDAAYAFGRGGNWFENLFNYLKNYIYPHDVDEAEKTLNEDYIIAGIERGIALMEHAISDTEYSLDFEKGLLKMVKGAGELELDLDTLYAAISQALLDRQAELEYDSLKQALSQPDFEALHAELAVEPADAYFDENFEIVPEVVGCSFDVEAAEKLWQNAAAGEEIRIPLQLSSPEIDTEALQAMLYRDKLGSQTTYYTWSSNNRINNIRLAADKINGLVLKPGDVFSFNESVGQRTQEAGFSMAGAYNDGQVVEDIGGGICQVSSTLYCAQMYAQLKTSNRVNHYFKVDYLDYGMDATVSWKTPDYKFTNSRDYPVKIVAYLDEENSALTIEIWGTDVDGSYVTLRQTSEALYDGYFTSVLVAYKVRTFRDVYDAEGNLIETISEPMGTYHLHDEDIKWPPEKYEQELTDFSNPLETLEQEKDKTESNENYLFDPDEYLGGIDIYS